MSHREGSLTPWIKSGGPELTTLPADVYDRAKAEGCDMRYFVRQPEEKPKPIQAISDEGW